MDRGERKPTHIPPNYVVEHCSHSSKAARGEDVQIEEPVCCGYSPAFHFHPTLTGMLGSTLIRYQVVQVRQASEERLLTPTWMVKALHGEQLAVHRVVGLIQ